MNLSGEQRKKLENALVDAFRDKASLERMVQYELNKNLNEIAPDSSLQGIIYKLIQKAEAEAWVEKLIHAALESNPGNLKLQNIARELSSSSATIPSENMIGSRNRNEYIFPDTIVLCVDNLDNITKENLLERTRVLPRKPGSLKLFGLIDTPSVENENWRLKDLLKNLPQEINRKWLEELVKSVYSALKGELDPNRYERNPQEVSTFQSSEGKLFRPILYKRKRSIDDRSIEFTVIFEEHISRGYVENAPNLAYATLVTAFILANRLQLEVCNKYLPMLDDWSQEVSEVIRTRLQEVRISFEYIEEDAERRRKGEAINKNNKDRLRDSFESKDERTTIESNLSVQQRYKNILLQADTRHNIDEVRVALTELKRLNKIVLRMIIQRLSGFYDADSP
ncbi:effector-associated domain EAD1-containing protein [Brasilonema bromeliae]|uniref:Effector-associated domain-containing protein n=1 Tax=Brasilonema bromeliae SPC951 TaxID=385972 RepID=A0ABX1P857_9CYAN|nr:effector-associated domain EAD1-containing protein [Brasilonema bromeliae]NMG20494.1 hypothetical protein [Brasilonema bromeliae SPC951]